MTNGAKLWLIKVLLFATMANSAAAQELSMIAEALRNATQDERESNSVSRHDTASTSAHSETWKSVEDIVLVSDKYELQEYLKFLSGQLVVRGKGDD